MHTHMQSRTHIGVQAGRHKHTHTEMQADTYTSVPACKNTHTHLTDFENESFKLVERERRRRVTMGRKEHSQGRAQRERTQSGTCTEGKNTVRDVHRGKEHSQGHTQRESKKPIRIIRLEIMFWALCSLLYHVCKYYGAAAAGFK